MKKIKSVFVLLACAGILHATDTTFVQKKIALQSVSMNAIINGNGFGLQYVPMLGVRFGKRIIISGGPRFSAADWKSTGYVIGTGYLLVRENKSYSGHVSLSSYFSITRIMNAHLSPTSVAYEKQLVSSIKNTETPNFESLQYSGWEYAAGFRLNYRCRCGLLFRTAVSYAYTETNQENFPMIHTSKQNNVGSLQLSAGIGWGFGKMMDKQKHESEMIAEEEAEDLLLTQK